MIISDKRKFFPFCLRANVLLNEVCLDCNKWDPIQGIPCLDDDCFSNKMIKQFETQGVIFPPVKAGDVIYMADPDEQDVYEIPIKGVALFEDQFYVSGGDFDFFSLDDESLFLTRDEAQAYIDQKGKIVEKNE